MVNDCRRREKRWTKIRFLLFSTDAAQRFHRRTCARGELHKLRESGSARRSSFCGFFTRPKGQTRLLVKCMIFTQMFTHRLLLFFINIPLSPSRALNKFLRSTYKFFDKLFFIDCPRCFYIKLIFLCMESNQGLAHASPSQWAQKISQQ